MIHFKLLYIFFTVRQSENIWAEKEDFICPHVPRNRDPAAHMVLGFALLEILKLEMTVIFFLLLLEK